MSEQASSTHKKHSGMSYKAKVSNFEMPKLNINSMTKTDLKQ